MIYYGGPAAVILEKENFIKLDKIQRMGKFFITEQGIFESSPLFEYRLRKQYISFYNSHGVKIDKKIVKMIKKYYAKKRDLMVLDLLHRAYGGLPDVIDDIFEAMQYIVDSTNHHAIDLDTEKYLYGHIAYNPKAVRMAKQFAYNSKKAIESLAPNVKKVIPFILIMGGLVAFAIVAQHLSEWIGGITAWIGNIHIGH